MASESEPVPQSQQEVCDVIAGEPPSVGKNPLPVYGELFEKRQLRKANAIRNRCVKDGYGGAKKARSEQTDTLAGNKKGRKQLYNRSEELEQIGHESKKLFRPHGLPKDIVAIPNIITFVDGIKLRALCSKIRDQHWSYICSRKIQFREKVWQLMHVDKIPCGNLRESFAYSFQIYLPEKSYLPIVHDTAMPW